VKRRDFLTLLGGAAAGWPLAARAQQQPAMPVVGLLNVSSRDTFEPFTSAFRQGLKETGYVENENMAIEYRWADGQYDRLPALAAELVRRQVSVIAALGTPAPGLAAKAATAMIPIVFQTGSDPVADGLVASMNRPGGNVTGVSRLNAELDPKRLEVLSEAVPAAAVLALLINPLNPSAESKTKNVLAAGRSLGRQVEILNATTEREIDEAFVTLRQKRAGALLVSSDTVFNTLNAQLAALTLRHAVPAIYSLREFAEAGGLMSYGASLADSFRQAGIYTGRILKGEKPGDLPVMQPTKFELVLNLKTAKALGLTVPPTLLAIADEVIE
jgi:putative ABC transport system substrate-binding protein